MEPGFSPEVFPEQPFFHHLADVGSEKLKGNRRAVGGKARTFQLQAKALCTTPPSYPTGQDVLFKEAN